VSRRLTTAKAARLRHRASARVLMEMQAILSEMYSIEGVLSLVHPPVFLAVPSASVRMTGIE
jgi:hypothetical protein